MKTKLLTLLLLAPLLLVRAQAQNPSAEEIISKYLTAIGGKDFLASISDMTVQVTTERQGNVMMITRKYKAPTKFSQTMNANGMELFKMVSDGSKVSFISMRGGNQTIEGNDARQAILQGMLFPELRFAEMGIKSTVEGKETIDGKEAYRVKHTDGTVSWTDFYDAASGLKVQTIAMQRSPQGQREQTSRLSAYKDFKGLKYPTILTQGGGQFQMEISVDKVKINDGVKESEFTIKN